MFYVDSYAKTADKMPTIIEAYKTRVGAEKRAARRRKFWPRVEVVENFNDVNQFAHGLNLEVMAP